MGTARDRPFLEVQFPKNQNLNVAPFEALVRQREYEHDAVVMRFKDADIIRRRGKYRHGQPVTFRWGWAPTSIETFVGYVHSTKVFTKNGYRLLEVYLVGASYRMNQTAQRTFKNTSTSGVVRLIAASHHFSFRTEVLPGYKARPVSDFFTQRGRSDFAMCVDQAKADGFSLDVQQTMVRFRTRDIDTRANGKQKVFKLGTNETKSSYGTPPPPVGRGALYGFTLKAGSAPLAVNRRLVMGGVDDQGKAFYAVDPRDADLNSDMASFDEYYLDSAPSSIHEGREAMSGLSGTDRYYVQAEVDVSGEPTLRSGETVKLAEVGPEIAGYWYVGEVAHEIRGQVAGSPSTYTCTLQLGRESLQQTVCIDLEPPTSWSGKDVVLTGCDYTVGNVGASTSYNPVDQCTPLETPAVATRVPRRKFCPGSTKPLPVATRIAPRLDVWASNTPTPRTGSFTRRVTAAPERARLS